MFTPEIQRESRHPFSLMLWIGLWLATACNLPLWQRLWEVPGLGLGKFLWVATLMTLMMVMAVCALLSLLNWRHTVRLLLTLLLLTSALNTAFLWQGDRFIDMAMLRDPLQTVRPFLGWKMLLTVLVLGVFPSFWVWSTPLRRIRLQNSIAQNFYFFIIVCLLLGGLWLLSLNQVQPLLHTQSQLQHLINPFNTLLDIVQELGGMRWLQPA